MINVTDKQLEIIKELAPDVEQYIASQDPNDFYTALDDAIIDYYDSNQEWLTPNGQKLQKLYDDIYSANEI
ncbi:hypothetical protein [Paenibacillus popilliae]|uniref:Nucleoside diphosphate kinase n=1 Tax=Paenibacillus popilliae ATCC 14706 TaxID=1212764 RepID=M9LNF9_PAEPP|nr:hypothetical protein [Paenibacillus popilliae]GAC41896.1 nucleoside diphosphate kinase [Paenibacillus popilliae ATCC 14706]